MQSLIHADIFFFITTIIVIILGILFVIIFAYFIIVLADIREISRIARKESLNVAEDISIIRQEVKDEFRKSSSVMLSLFKVFRGLFNKRKFGIKRSNK